MSDGERESLLAARAEREVLQSSLCQAKHRADELSVVAESLRKERDALSESLSLAKGQRDAAREGLAASRTSTEALQEELERARCKSKCHPPFVVLHVCVHICVRICVRVHSCLRLRFSRSLRA